MHKRKLYARVAIGTDLFGGWLFHDCYTAEELHRIMEQIMKRKQNK